MPVALDGALVRAARRFGTPLYVTDGRRARGGRRPSSATPSPTRGSGRTRSRRTTSRRSSPRLGARGLGANVVSRGEWAVARPRAGIPNDRITLEGIGKTAARPARRGPRGGRRRSRSAGSRSESPEELDALAALATRAGLGRAVAPPLDVLVRLNPDVAPGDARGPGRRRGLVEVRHDRDRAVAAPWRRLGRGRAAACARDPPPRRVAARRGRRVARRRPARRSPCSRSSGRGCQASTRSTSAAASRSASPGRSRDPARFARELAPLLEALPRGPAAGAARRRARTVPRRARRAGSWRACSTSATAPTGTGSSSSTPGMTELIRPALYGAHHPIAALTSLGGVAVEAPDPDDVRPPASTARSASAPTRFDRHDLPPLRRGDLVAIARRRGVRRVDGDRPTTGGRARRRSCSSPTGRSRSAAGGARSRADRRSRPRRPARLADMSLPRDRFATRLAAAPAARGRRHGHAAVLARHPPACLPRRAGHDPPGPGRRVHREYLDAGADLIETLTFGANRFRLDAYGLAAEAGRFNRRAAQVAREARDVSGRDAWVGGSIGPLGPPTRELRHPDDAAIRAAFREQIDGLLEGGVDLLILETFFDLDHLLLAVDEARGRGRPAGHRLDDLRRGPRARRRHDAGGRGRRARSPPASTRSASTAASGRSRASMRWRSWARPATASPRARSCPTPACPQRIEGQFVYAAEPAYFGSMVPRLLDAGARIVGGCCGTTPDHIAAMRAALDALGTRRRDGPARARPGSRRGTRRPHRVRRQPADRVRRGRRRRPRRPPERRVAARPGAGRRAVRRLGRDRPAALRPHRPHARGRPAPAQAAGVDVVNVSDSRDGPRADGRAGRRVRDPARPRPRVPRPHHDPRPEPDGPRVGAARRPRARRPQHPRPHRRPAADRRLPDRHGRLGRRLDRPHRDPRPAQPGRGPGRARRSASRPASRSRARSTRRPPTRRPSGTASNASSTPAPT